MVILKKKVIWIVSLVLILYLPQFVYVNAGKAVIYSKTLSYLTSQGYSRNDIKSIEVHHSFLNVVLSYNEWEIRVVFKDEPNAIYIYDYEDKSVHQYGVAGRPVGKIYTHTEGGPTPVYSRMKRLDIN